MSNIKRPECIHRLMLGTSLLVLGCLFWQPVEAMAQSNWPASILIDAAQAVAASSKITHKGNGNQSQTGGKGGVTIQSMTAGQIPKFTNGSGNLDDSLITESTGNVGIGTTTPAERLVVTTTNPIVSILPEPGGSGRKSAVLFHGTFGNVPADTWPRKFGKVEVGSTSAWGDVYMAFKLAGGDCNTDGGNIDQLACERMRITNSGNAGIGTTTPSARLHINAFPLDPGQFLLSNWNGTGNQVPLYANNPIPSTDAGGNPQAALPVLVLSREGRGGIAFANFAEFKLSRYAHSGTLANTQLDIALTAGDNVAAGANIMSLRSNGNVGIGTLSPRLRLDVIGGIAAGDYPVAAANVNAYNLEVGGPTAGPNGAQAAILFHHHSVIASQLRYNGGTLFWEAAGNGYGTSPTPTLQVNGAFYAGVNGGNVGIGTTGPVTALTAFGASADPSATANNGILTVWGSNTAQLSIGSQPSSPFGMYLQTKNANNGGTTYPLYLNPGGGNVGIGITSPPQAKLDVAGGINASGTISGANVIAKYQDVAEWVPTSHTIPAGTVVTLDPETSNQVEASSRAYDTRVAGVVSAKPGVILGEGGEGKVMVATTGRVRVKVDATNAPIRVGDLLVTSDKEGIAMRSLPLDLGGTPIHRPGTLIGKALEPLEKGVGEILVLLSLQ